LRILKGKGDGEAAPSLGGTGAAVDDGAGIRVFSREIRTAPFPPNKGLIL